MTQAMDFVFALALRLGALIMQAIGSTEAALRSVMSGAGIDDRMQAIVLVGVVVLCVVAALRVFGGLLRFLIVVFLILLLIHALVPGLRVADMAHT